MRYLAALAPVAAASAFWWSSVPFAWLWSAFGVGLLAAAAFARRSGWRALWVNAAVVLFSLSAAEAYFHFDRAGGDGSRFAGSYTQDYFVEHPVLGYGPEPGRRVETLKYHGEELIYEAAYTIGGNGLRVTPISGSAPLCVAVFGGSVTFGEGVQDEQSMPFVLGRLLEGRAQVHNFGFHGYGPHQMLAAFESGMVRERVRCEQTHFIYQAIFPHIARVAGLTSWDKHGPRYVLDRERAVRAGHFDEPGGSAPTLAFMLRRLGERSAIYRRVAGRERALRDDDVWLYVAVIAEARRVAAAQFPGSRFSVLLWDRSDPMGDTVISGLRGRAVELYRISDALPGYPGDAARYHLSPWDEHPSAETHERIACYVADAMLSGPAGSKGLAFDSSAGGGGGFPSSESQGRTAEQKIQAHEQSSNP